MTACSEHETLLWMDIHGEMDTVQRRVWENHLQNCAGCQEEKAITTDLMTRMKEAMTPPPLTDTAVLSAVERIGSHFEALKSYFSKPSGHRSPIIRFVPLAALCTLLLFIALHHFKENSSDTSPSTNVSMIAPLSDIQKDDEEVIENMDFLSDFDTIEEIVKVIDPEDDVTVPENGTPENSQNEGERAHG
jgi:hypothetical protein